MSNEATNHNRNVNTQRYVFYDTRSVKAVHVNTNIESENVNATT